MQLTAAAHEAEIEFNPSSLNFGTTLTDLSVTIKNNGNATAEWSLNLGNNSWLSASELAGSIQAGRTQSIIFTVDRNFLSEPKSTVINLHAFGNSYPLTISCAPGNATSEMTVDPKMIDFGANDTEKTLTIRNTGKGTLSWTATGITSNAVSLSQTSGSVAAGGNTVLKVFLDRTLFEGSLSTSFTINDGVKSEVITVTANTSGSGSNPSGDNGDIVETKGLYAYFPFNGSLEDLGENKLNSYVSPDASYVAGVKDGSQALSFSRKDGTIFTVNEGLIDHTSITVSFWLKDIDEGNIFWVTSSNNFGNVQFYDMMCLSYVNGHLKYVMRRNNIYWNNDIGNFTHKAIDDGEWHHVALVSDFNKENADYVTTTLYVDGIKMDTVKEEYSASNEKYPSDRHYDTGIKFTIGGSNTPNMKVANLRVYNSRKLNAEQIKTIYDAKQ